MTPGLVVNAELHWPPDSFAEWCRQGGVVVGDTVMVAWRQRPAFPFVVTAIGERLILAKNANGTELVLGGHDDLAVLEAMTRQGTEGPTCST